ncbi:alpha-mannosidase [Spirosoma endbachense]|uniref:Glycoside hydrolase n=1 Tax=Spirosoma endbachense TaxID=2666025 RepID=A0A6P1W5Z6_9BACT|nr:glycoside hydrolase family 38 C-terminal domain-containing protein [Spirosoma endbachense]QHW00335.1 glycoside hydrolase [Spirosoma endbachense]
MKIVILILSLITFAFALQAQPKKIYLANDDHTDFMWTGDEETYKKAFSEMLDYYIKLNDSTAHLPYNLQSKWNCDGSYWVYNYRETRSPEQFNKLIKQIKDGKITVPLNSMIVLLGAAPAEATLRDMYYAGSLKRKYGLDLSLVLNMEDQVLPLGLSSLWAGSGAKYSWKGVCACATKVTGLDRHKHQMYWYKGLDDQKVLMKWYSVNPSMITNRKEYRYNLGTYLEAAHQANAVLDCKALMNDPVYPYNIAAAFGKGGDDLKTLTPNFPKIAREKTDSAYQVIVSNEIDFFNDFEKQYGASLPTETISYGSTEWGNSFASLAEVSAAVKRAVEKLRTAEALYTLVALKDKTFATDLAAQKEKAWLACGMYFEHDWTADGPHITRKQRADWQKKTATTFISYVDTLYNRSVKRLGQLIAKPKSATESFYVFNPLNWTRTDYSDYPYSGPTAIRVIDKTEAKEIPFQVITKKGKSYLRILASNIPSVGYKVFDIQKNINPTVFPTNLVVTDSTIENRFYKLKFTAQGVITSLVDKSTNRECVKAIDKLYINDLGSGVGNEGEKIRIENKGSVSATLVASTYKPIKHTTKLTLFNNSDRIELENYITQNLDAKPVTYSFSLNLEKPDTWHEEAGAILHVKSKTKGGNYADTASRFDWLAMNHFADMSDAGNGMFLSNRDAYFMKVGKSSNTKLDDSTPQLNILAAGQIDHALGMINQDGDSYFEHFFALKPHTGRFKSSEAMRFSLEHQNPLIAQTVRGGSGYDGKQFSLFSFSDPDAVIWALKPAEEGIDKGVVMRVWNVADKNKSVTISGNNLIEKGFSTTHIETDDQKIPLEKGKLNTVLGHNRLHTFRLFF